MTPAPTRRLSRAQRIRIVDVLRAEMGLPSLAKERRQREVRMLRIEEGMVDLRAGPRPRGKPQPIDTTELDAIRAAMKEWRRERRALQGLLGYHLGLEGAQCLACGEVFVPPERLPICVTPTALGVWHSYRCRARGW